MKKLILVTLILSGCTIQNGELELRVQKLERIEILKKDIDDYEKFYETEKGRLSPSEARRVHNHRRELRELLEKERAKIQ